MNSTKIHIENINPRFTQRKYDILYKLLSHKLTFYDLKSGPVKTKWLESSKYNKLVRFIYPKQDYNGDIKNYKNKTKKFVVKYGPKPTESQALVGLRYNAQTFELKVNLSIGDKCKFPNDITDTINEIAGTRDLTLLNSIYIAPDKDKGLIRKLVEFSNRYNI